VTFLQLQIIFSPYLFLNPYSLSYILVRPSSRFNDQLYETYYIEHMDNLEFAGNVAVNWKEDLFLHLNLDGYLKHVQIKEASKQSLHNLIPCLHNMSKILYKLILRFLMFVSHFTIIVQCIKW